MTNGQLDLGLILFKIGQYALVFFIGYLIYNGLIYTAILHKKLKQEGINKEIAYYKKLMELEKTKEEYNDYLKYKDYEEDEDLVVNLELQGQEKDYIQTTPINNNEEEEVEIKNISELLKEDPDFLSHSENLEDINKKSTDDETKVLKLNDIPVSENDTSSLEQTKEIDFDEIEEEIKSQRKSLFNHIVSLFKGGS